MTDERMTDVGFEQSNQISDERVAAEWNDTWPIAGGKEVHSVSVGDLAPLLERDHLRARANEKRLEEKLRQCQDRFTVKRLKELLAENEELQEQLDINTPREALLQLQSENEELRKQVKELKK